MFTDTKNVFIENSTLIQHTHSQLGEGDVIIKDPRRGEYSSFDGKLMQFKLANI